MAETPENDATLQDHGPPASMTDDLSKAPRVDDAPELAPEKKASSPLKKAAMLVLKLGVSAFCLYYVYGKALAGGGVEEFEAQLASIDWRWFAFAAVMQVTAIGFSIMRWRLLLGGQGIRARASFLVPSFMIGRMWGAFTPGGLGLDGWRLYDVARHTKKIARPIAVAVVEKVLGQLAFGIVVMGGSVWGLELVGVSAVIAINMFFLVLVTTGLTFLSRPRLFLPLFALLPRQLQPRLKSLFEAVSAYHGKYRLLLTAVLCAVGVHSFNNLVFVSAAEAMHLPVSPMMLFFTSSIVSISTIAPISVNGVGVREATAAGVLGAFGVPPAIAAATFTLGFLAEMCVSAIGIPIYLARRAGYDAKLEVDDADREERLRLEAEREEQRLRELGGVPESQWPRPLRGLTIGLGAGLLAGMLVGVTEGAVILIGGGGRVGYGVLAYGAVAYGLFCALGGGAFGFMSALLRRTLRLAAVPEPKVYARLTGLIVALLGFRLSTFRIGRDVYAEELVWKSADGLLVLGGCLLAAVLIYALLSIGLRVFTSARVGRFMLRAWGSPVFVASVVVVIVGVTLMVGHPAEANGDTARPAPPNGAPNVLVIVVDTLRADHLPAYGYSEGSTPNLDRFAEDSVRYEHAFSNSSWTRPSFASILTGRYASSHGVMAKPDALPDAVETLPETLRDHGYETAGYVTNFNVGSYFNFQQGFHEYTFLEPEFVLGADDSAAKLLLVQVMRQTIERVRAMRGTVEPGTAYQDAETVNRHLTSWLDRAPSDRPWFLFAGYMDPHDPYFPHPYDGSGYSRAAHQTPSVEEADMLRGLYDGEITYWDQQFGALIEDLRRRGLYDDMMIVITADHGEEFGEHGGFWHGTTLYDEQVHVPLFVKLPRNERAGTRIGHWVQSIDLMPSILARVGIDIPGDVQGGQLDEGTTRVYAEESHEGNVLESVRELVDFEEFKLITANPNNPRGLAPVELYRIADDPREQANVAESHADSVRTLVGVMDQARARAAEGAIEAQSTEMTEETRAHLCQIGYIDTEECCRDGLLPASSCP